MSRGTDPCPAPRRIEELFEVAIGLAGPERAELLDRLQSEAPELCARLRALLDAHTALRPDDLGPGGFLHALDAPRAAALLEERPDAEPGAMVGRYRIVRRLARGGMGVVFLAGDPALDRPVAVKLLPRYLSADPAANRRFVEEARAASALDHPHIATVYEIGETDDERLFIAMAYYEGETLRDRLRGGPLPVTETVEIAVQVAGGLAAAHAAAIVHRDIKPENLILAGHGIVKILDFGVAKVAAGALTRTGATLGTVAYMSPEQTRGGPVDPRADLWSLGVVMYELLVGRRPFTGDNNDAVIYGIRHDGFPPLRELRPDVPPSLAAAVERCLEKEPARRFASATELEASLRGICSDAASVGAAHRRTHWHWAAVYSAAAWLAFRASAPVSSHLLLPDWVPAAVLVLLLIGLPVVIGAAMTPPGPARQPSRTGRDPFRLAAGLLTWRRAIVGGVVAFTALAVASGSILLSGMPRVTDAHGAAGEAFGERGWVVVTDFDASPDDAEVALAAREALVVDLEQSGFVNVFGRSQLAAILRRMGRPGDDALDLAVALEVAERAGAGAVLSATITRLGPDYVLSARAVRPGSGEEMFSVRTAAGTAQLLGAVEQLSREVRRRFGEQRDAVRRSRPLPAVSTRSLHALKLYAEADRAASVDYAAAATLTAEAIAEDPGFAMAHRLAGAIAASQLRHGDARDHLIRAYELRDRLTDRERWHVEALYQMTVALDPRRAADRYELLLRRYPDDARATFNLGSILLSWLRDYESAYARLRNAVELDPQSPIWLSAAIHAAFFADRPADADSLALLAGQRGFDGTRVRWRLSRAVALDDHAGAVALCDSLLAGPGGARGIADHREFCGSIDVAGGRLVTGIARLEAAERTHRDAGRYRNIAHTAQAIAVAHGLRGDIDEAAAVVAGLLERIPAASIPEPDRYFTRINLQVQAALLDRPELVARIGEAYPPYPDSTHWISRLGEGLVVAALAVAAGDGTTALRRLRAGAPDDEFAIGWRIWEELIRGRAFELIGRPDSAAIHFRRAADPRYRTSGSLTKDRMQLPIALRGLAEMEAAAGNPEAAATAYRRLLALWAGADPELRGEVDAVRRALARLGTTLE